MSVVDFVPTWSGQSASAEISTGGSVLAWTVTVDDPANDNAETVKHEVPIPAVHPSNPLSFLTSMRVRRTSPIYFEVEGNYGIDLTGDKGEDPINRPVVVTLPPSVSFSSSEEPVDTDAAGVALRNINGEGFDPPPTQEFNDLILNFEKNVATIDYTEFSELKSAVCNTGFYGFAAGKPRCIDINAKPAQEGEFIFYKQTAVIAIREPLADTPAAKTWWRRLIHEGFYEKIGGKIVRALDEEGEPMTKPVLLDATSGARITDPALAQWHYSRKYREIDFDDYNLI